MNKLLLYKEIQLKINDVVEVIDFSCITRSKVGVVEEINEDKIKIAFDAGWIGWYKPNQLQKRS